MKTQFKTADGTLVHFEKSADVVKYGSGTLAQVLDGLQMDGISDYGREILKAQNAAELRKLLEVRKSLVQDEYQNVWQAVGNPTISAANAKFDNALQCTAKNYLKSKTGIIFGGNPFTMSFWIYVSSTSAESVFFDIGVLNIKILIPHATPASVRFVSSTGTTLSQKAFYSNAHHHIEVGYSGGTLYTFVDGALGQYNNFPIPRNARSIVLGGGAVCSFSDFRLQDGVCLHTANFSPPTTRYTADQYTTSLLHFG